MACGAIPLTYCLLGVGPNYFSLAFRADFEPLLNRPVSQRSLVRYHERQTSEGQMQLLLDNVLLRLLSSRQRALSTARRRLSPTGGQPNVIKPRLPKER